MKCAICKNKIIGYGNNGRPLVDGLVCDSCNLKVILERLRLSKEAKDSVKKEANEAVSLGEIDGVVVGSGGPVNTTNPMEDFEKYAKQFEETFILGKFSTRKEKPVNKTKVVKGEVVGEIDSVESKEVKLEQPEPEKSATESLKVGDRVQLDDYRRDSKSGTIKNIFSSAPGATSYKIKWDDGTESVEIKGMVKSSTEALHGFSEIYEFLALCKELGLNTLDKIDRFVKDNPGDPLKVMREYRKELGMNWENTELTDKDKEDLWNLKLKELYFK